MGEAPPQGGATDGDRTTFLEFAMVKQLQRELNYELVDSEFNAKVWRNFEGRNIYIFFFFISFLLVVITQSISI